MTYFAEVRDGFVVEVRVSEVDFLPALPNGSSWLETFFDGSQRYNYAGIGFTYDEARDAFIPPKPFESWVLDEDTCLWVAPIAYPAEGAYTWDEEAGDWVEVTEDTVE
tara:strand:- start:2344 stop:2667 length:324 start_codon:yes stop_codon:yes gene_type:complete